MTGLELGERRSNVVEYVRRIGTTRSIDAAIGIFSAAAMMRLLTPS